jgi:predicted site-specific integrase-resolvase
MKLSDWAKQQGISYKTAWRWFKNGTLPVPHSQAPTGTIIVFPDADKLSNKVVAIYARVSSHDQKKDDDLVADMIEVLTSFCARLYGRRSAKNKAKKAIEAIKCEEVVS